MTLQSLFFASFFRAPCEGASLQRVRVPPGKGSLQPEAIGAAVEVTKLLEPPV